MDLLAAIGNTSMVRLRLVVEPAESAILYDASLVDELEAVSTEDAKEMARRLAREEALFAGTSSGSNVVAALRVARRLGSSRKVVT